MEDDAAVDYLLGLQTAEQRRAATAVSRSELLASVRALAGCQRCGFVEQVLAAFDPELAASASPSAVPNGSLSGDSAAPATAHDAAIDGSLRNMHAMGVDLGSAGLPTASLAARPDSVSVSTSAATSAVMAPAQLLALLSSSGGSADLVGLLQFAWKDGGTGGTGGSGGGSGGALVPSGCLSLSDTLLCKPRLLRRFLSESAATMQALSDDVGDCRRHVGYPGPSELASTLARLELQRSHTLERLAAWGVLRAPPAPLSTHQQAQAPGQPPPPPQHLRARPRDGDGAGAAASVEAQNGQACGQVATVVEEEGEGYEDDVQLALAIRFSLQDTGLAPASPAVRRGTEGYSPGHMGRNRQQQQQGTPTSLQRRAQRTPPRPTGGAAAAVGSGGGGPEQSSPSRWLGTWPGPSPGRSPASSVAGGSRRHRQAVEGLAASLEGLAACGLAEDSPAGTATPQPPGLPSPQQPRPRLSQPSPPAPNAPAGIPPPPMPPGSGTSPSVLPAVLLAAPAAVLQGQGSSPAALSPSAAQKLPGEQPQGRQPPPQQPHQQAGAGPPLAVSAAVSAAAGLPDAAVLVDAATVAALPGGLRQRVEHLVAQLVQVQQRRGRLEHACQHGIVAGGRKLLLILLQMMWTEMRRAAAAAADADAAATAAPAARPAEAGAAGTPSSSQRSTGMTPQRGQEQPVPLGSRQPLQQLSQQPLQQLSQRRPRYEGLLADLAAGLGEDDTHMDLGPGLAGLGWGDDDDDGAAADVSPTVSRLLDQLSDGELSPGSGLRDRGDGGGDSVWLREVGAGHGPAALLLPNGLPLPRQPPRFTAAALAEEQEDEGEGWDAARTSYTRIPVGSALRQSGAPPRVTAASGARRAASVVFPPGVAAAALAGARGGSAATRWPPGDSGERGGERARWLALERGCGTCQPECLAVRSEQADQLRVLQCQLDRCQSSQSELQCEVGRLLDMMAEQRKLQEQATSSLRREMSQWQGEAQALQGLGAEELAELAGRMEAALSRVRAAHLQAAAERDNMCPVCWERRKGLVFGCGHQICCACGEKLAACPICREPVSLRIKVYG